MCSGSQYERCHCQQRNRQLVLAEYGHFDVLLNYRSPPSSHDFRVTTNGHKFKCWAVTGITRRERQSRRARFCPDGIGIAGASRLLPPHHRAYGPYTAVRSIIRLERRRGKRGGRLCGTAARSPSRFLRAACLARPGSRARSRLRFWVRRAVSFQPRSTSGWMARLTSPMALAAQNFEPSTGESGANLLIRPIFLRNRQFIDNSISPCFVFPEWVSSMTCWARCPAASGAFVRAASVPMERRKWRSKAARNSQRHDGDGSLKQVVP